MKRSASSAFETASTSYRRATPPPTQQDGDVAGNADAAGSIALEENQHAINPTPGHTEPMPFPGPYAHDPVPVVVARFGPADDVAMPAPLTTSGVTEASSTATTSVVRANAPAGGSGPGATSTEHPETSPLSDGKDLNPDGLPPLIFAAKRGDLDQLRTLLEQPGVDINQVDARYGSTASMFAAEAGNLDVVEFLLARGVDVNYKNRKNGTAALLFASLAGKLDVVNVLLKHPGVLVQQTNNDGMTALACAAHNGHANVVNALLDAGLDVNFKDPECGRTALITASAAGKLDVVNVLLKHPGVLVEQTSSNGTNALAAAAQRGHADIVNALLDKGAAVNFTEQKYGGTALIAASLAGKLDVVSVLLDQHGIFIDQTANNGMNALACAAQRGHADIVGRLLDAGADMAFLDGRGQTCLQVAIANGHASVVECLRARGAPLPDPLAIFPAASRNIISLSDLFQDWKMPAASPDNLLNLTDPHLLDEHQRFFQKLVAASSSNEDGNASKALADWFAA